MCIFGRQPLRGPMMPTPAVHPPEWCSLYWNSTGLCDYQHMERRKKRPLWPNGDFHFAPLPLCLLLLLLSCMQLFCDPMGYSPSGYSVHGISQARILEWGAMPFSRRSSRPKDRTCVSCTGRWILYHWATWNLVLFVCQFLLGPLLHSSVERSCHGVSGPVGMPTWQGTEASGHQPVRIWCLKAHW